MKIRTLVCIAFSLVCLAPISCSKDTAGDAANYEILHKVILQPIDHSNPDGPKLEQRVDVLIPHGAPADSPVFFNLGNETDATDDDLRGFHRSHGARNDIIYVQAEHRGYGQSLTDDEDQSVPSYVRIDQVLADTHEVVTRLKEEYPGPWMAAGWSYGGGLVIEYGNRYPNDVAVVMASSGVVDWPFMDYGYDRQVRETLGDACYERLAQHLATLEPEELFDDNWMQREFLQATTQGMVQYPSLKRLRPVFKLLTRLSTPTFVKVMRRMDDMFGDGEAWRYAQATGATSVGPKEVEAGLHNWHVWRYQMCAEIGGFIASEESQISDEASALFTRNRDDFIEECRAQFGEEPQSIRESEWSQREMAGKLTVPLVYVNGGKDPWHSVCLEPDFEIKNGRYFFVPEGLHCPERADPDLARQVLEEMLKYARAGL